jgi:hypothetical protein
MSKMARTTVRSSALESIAAIRERCTFTACTAKRFKECMDA